MKASNRVWPSRMLFSGTYSAWVCLVDQHGVALGEGAALHVLAGQADAVAFQQQGAEGQRLAGRPVDALAGVDRLPLGLELARRSSG